MRALVMGKKFKISKSKLKKRPKKRGEYKEKPHDPKKPRTNDELEKVYPGYKAFSRLQRGILETDLEDTEDNLGDEDGADVTENFIPPNNWGRLMSDDKATQLLFEEKLSQQRAKFKDGLDDSKEAWDDMVSGKPNVEDELRDRLQQIQDRNPSFIKNLTFLVSPILNNSPLSNSPDDTSDNLDEFKGNKTRAETSVSKMEPEQVRAMCQKRFGLMSLEALLNIIDRMNQATSGKLNQQKKQ
jgi:hypothetical protein